MPSDVLTQSLAPLAKHILCRGGDDFVIAEWSLRRWKAMDVGEALVAGAKPH